MSITAILTAVLVVGGVGLFLGIFLGIASIVFKVEVDEKEESVLGVLPGNNCGGCGYPGCSGLAAAIAKGEAPVNACPVGGESVGKKVAAIMGVEAGDTVRMTAFVKCSGDCERQQKFMSIPVWRIAALFGMCQMAVRSPVIMVALDMEIV